MHNIAQIFRGNVNFSATKTTDLSSPLPIGICTQGWGLHRARFVLLRLSNFSHPLPRLFLSENGGRDFCVI